MPRDSTNSNNTQIDEACQLIKVGRVAELLGISRRTVWRRAAAGELPSPRHIGNVTLWRKQDILMWVERLFNTPPEEGQERGESDG